MRKRIAAKNTRIFPVRFHLEDLTDLVALFKKYCESVEISDDKAIYDSLTEAAEKVVSPITNLEITGKNPGIVLSLKSTGSWLTQRFDKPVLQEGEDDKYDLAYAKIKEFLDDHRAGGIILSGWFPTTFVLGAIVIVAVGLGVQNLARYGDAAFIVGLILTVAWLSLLRTLYLDIGVVLLKPRGAVITFWGRNKDAVKMLIIGAVIGVVGTIITEWFKSYIKTK